MQSYRERARTRSSTRRVILREDHRFLDLLINSM